MVVFLVIEILTLNKILFVLNITDTDFREDLS